MGRLIQKIKDFAELVMFQHTLFSLPFIFTAMITASKLQSGSVWFGWKILFLVVLAAVSARNFAMGINRYFDRDIDALNPRTANRPSVDGRIKSQEIAVFIALNGVIFIVVSYLINTLAFALSFFVLAVLGAYTFFKRFSATAHLFLGLALGLSPIAGAIAVSGEIPLWSIWLGLGVMCWVAGFDILYSLQDIDFDAKHGLYSVPVRYGPSLSLLLGFVSHLFAVVFWVLYIFEARFSSIAYLVVLVVSLMLLYEHYLVRKDYKHIERAFFVVNVYVGVVFLIGMICVMAC